MARWAYCYGCHTSPPRTYRRHKTYQVYNVTVQASGPPLTVTWHSGCHCAGSWSSLDSDMILRFFMSRRLSPVPPREWHHSLCHSMSLRVFLVLLRGWYESHRNPQPHGLSPWPLFVGDMTKKKIAVCLLKDRKRYSCMLQPTKRVLREISRVYSSLYKAIVIQEDI